MKAKDVVAKINAVERKPGELPGEFADRQAAVLLDCGFVKFKANCASRWPKGKASLQSIVALRKEFTQWGQAIITQGQFDWMRPTVGTVLFDTILREVEQQATGGEVLLRTLHALDAKPNTLRMGV